MNGATDAVRHRGAGRPAGDDVFVKRRSDAPAGFFAVEAAGLRWLAAVPGGVRVVEPLEVGRRPPRAAPPARGGPHAPRRPRSWAAGWR